MTTKPKHDNPSQPNASRTHQRACNRIILIAAVAFYIGRRSRSLDAAPAMPVTNGRATADRELSTSNSRPSWSRLKSISSLPLRRLQCEPCRSQQALLRS